MYVFMCHSCMPTHTSEKPLRHHFLSRIHFLLSYSMLHITGNIFTKSNAGRTIKKKAFSSPRRWSSVSQSRVSIRKTTECASKDGLGCGKWSWSMSQVRMSWHIGDLPLFWGLLCFAAKVAHGHGKRLFMMGVAPIQTIHKQHHFSSSTSPATVHVLVLVLYTAPNKISKCHISQPQDTTSQETDIISSLSKYHGTRPYRLIHAKCLKRTFNVSQ